MVKIAKILILALAVYREAAHEPFEGKLAVAQVIENRVQSKRWPMNYSDVILQRYQFSSFGKRDRKEGFRFPSLRVQETWAWIECVQAAREVLSSNVDYAAGANHFLNEEVVRSRNQGRLPWWVSASTRVMRIGNHTFYQR